MRGERLEIYQSLLLNRSKRIVTIVQTVQRRKEVVVLKTVLVSIDK